MEGVYEEVVTKRKDFEDEFKGSYSSAGNLERKMNDLNIMVNFFCVAYSFPRYI